MNYRGLWISLTIVMVGSFAVLGYYGKEIYRQAPPIPERVVTTEGDLLFTGQDIRDGQNVWQSMGGQELGSIWGHGAYVAPDWSADWLHRECVWILDHWAQAESGVAFDKLDVEQAAALQARLKVELAQIAIPRKPLIWSFRRCGHRRSRLSAITILLSSATIRNWPNSAMPTRFPP